MCKDEEMRCMVRSVWGELGDKSSLLYLRNGWGGAHGDKDKAGSPRKD